MTIKVIKNGKRIINIKSSSEVIIMQIFKYLKACEKTKTTIVRKFLIMVSITVPDGNVSHGKFLSSVPNGKQTEIFPNLGGRNPVNHGNNHLIGVQKLSNYGIFYCYKLRKCFQNKISVLAYFLLTPQITMEMFINDFFFFFFLLTFPKQMPAMTELSQP